MRKKRRGRRGVKEEGVGNQVVYAVAVQCAEQHKVRQELSNVIGRSCDDCHFQHLCSCI
jgi:hypothetical protein